MKKLFFIVMIALYSTLIFASGTIPWPNNNSTSSGSNNPNETISFYVPESQLKPSKTTTSSSSSSTTLCNENVNLSIQQIAVLILSSFEQQKKQTSRPQRTYDDSYLKADAATIEKWKLRGKTATTSTTQLQTVTSEELAQSDAKATSCAQIRTILAACIDENESFWKIRDVYIDSGCEEPADEVQDLPENACYSIPFGATAAFYGISHVAPLAGSAIGSAFLAAAPPLVMCAVVYTGSKFVVSLIKNYQKSKYETPEFKLARDAAEKYASDFQSALDRTLHIGSVNAIPTHPIYYAMSYGYGDDPYAKVVTIVDKQQKQHIFVVPEDLNKWPFQISDGSLDSYYAMHYRYLVPQSTIDAVIAMQRAQEQKAQEVKNKAIKDKTKAVLDDVGSSSNLTSKSPIANEAPISSQVTQSLEMSSSEPKAPEQQGCGHIDPEHSKSEILTSPMPEPQEPSNEGCGKSAEIEKSTDTAHASDPEIRKVQDQSLPGGMDCDSHQSDLFNAKQNHDKSCDVKKSPEVEPKEGSPEWKKLHPHGKYEDAGYHKPENISKSKHNSKKNNAPKKSPAPQNGQKALDNSVPVEKSPHRASIEDDKYVTLYKTENGEYHGFVNRELKEVPLKILEALKKHKLVHPKSGAILKK